MAQTQRLRSQDLSIKGILAFPWLFEKFVNPKQPTAKPKYQCCLLIDKSDVATLNELFGVYNAFENEVKAKYNGTLPFQFKRPIHDGDVEKPGDETFANRFYVNLSSEMRQPFVVDLARNPILDKSQIYSGAIVYASFSLYDFSTGSVGIGTGLNGILKYADGEPIGGGGISADAAFANVPAAPVQQAQPAYGYNPQPAQQQPYGQPAQPAYGQPAPQNPFI